MRERVSIQSIMLVLFWFASCNIEAANGAGVIDSESSGAQILLLEWASETAGQLTPQTVSSDEAVLDFHLMPASRNVGQQERPVWIHSRIDLPDIASRFMLIIDYAQLDVVEAYWQENGEWVTHLAGDRLPFLARSERAPLPTFRLPEYSGLLDIYFRVQVSGSLQFPLQLIEQGAYAEQQTRSQFLMGLYFAIIGTMMLYNVFLFTATRDWSFLFLVGYLIGVLGFQGTFTGYAAMYLWPNATDWSHWATIPFICLCVSSGTLFVNSMTGNGKVVPSAGIVLPALASIMIIPLLILTVSYSLALQVLIPLALICVLYFPWPISIALVRGYRPARFAALGLLCIFPGALLLMGRHFNWLPVSFWYDQSFRMGTAAEAIIFSLAVADRLNLLREERNVVQNQLLQTEQQALRAQLDYSHRLLSAQDTERKRLARELHDGFGQVLATFSNTLKRWMRKDVMPELEEYQEATELTRNMMEDIRSLSHILHPQLLDQLGLKAALLTVINQAGNSPGLGVGHNIQDLEKVLNDEEKLHIYRLAQEALSNIQRHAHATQADVQLIREDDNVVLRVSDNGIGLPADAKDQSLGLTSMRERARAMGARLAIAGRVDRGTTVELTLPIRKVI